MRGGRSDTVTRSYIHIDVSGALKLTEIGQPVPVAIKLGLGVAACSVFLKAVVWHLPRDAKLRSTAGMKYR